MNLCKISEIIEELNDGIKDILDENLFVVDINITGTEYYYCDESEKIKVKTVVFTNINDYLCGNKEVQETVMQADIEEE